MNTYTTNLARASGDDEFQGLVDYTFTRPDGTQLGTQGALLAVSTRTDLTRRVQLSSRTLSMPSLSHWLQSALARSTQAQRRTWVHK